MNVTHYKFSLNIEGEQRGNKNFSLPAFFFAAACKALASRKMNSEKLSQGA